MFIHEIATQYPEGALLKINPDGNAMGSMNILILPRVRTVTYLMEGWKYTFEVEEQNPQVFQVDADPRKEVAVILAPIDITSSFALGNKWGVEH